MCVQVLAATANHVTTNHALTDIDRLGKHQQHICTYLLILLL